MADFAAFQQRKQELLDALDRLIELVGQESVVWDPEAEVRTLTRFKDELSGDLLFKVLCVGDFSTGKSTFINRFLLEQDLLPAYPIPTTTLPTRIRYGAQLKALLYSAEGEPQEVTEGVRERLIECVRPPARTSIRYARSSWRCLRPGSRPAWRSSMPPG